MGRNEFRLNATWLCHWKIRRFWRLHLNTDRICEFFPWLNIEMIHRTSELLRGRSIPRPTQSFCRSGWHQKHFLSAVQNKCFLIFSSWGRYPILRNSLRMCRVAAEGHVLMVRESPCRRRKTARRQRYLMALWPYGFPWVLFLEKCLFLLFYRMYHRRVGRTVPVIEMRGRF